MFTSGGWWRRTEISPVRDSPLARSGPGALHEAGVPGHGGNTFLAYVCLFEFFLLYIFKVVLLYFNNLIYPPKPLR